MKKGFIEATIVRKNLNGSSVIDILKSHIYPHSYDTPSTDVMGEVDPGEEILYVDGVSIAYDRGIEILRNASFKLRRGEILSIVSTDGKGDREICDTIYGLRRPARGSIRAKRSVKIRYIPGEISRHRIRICLWL